MRNRIPIEMKMKEMKISSSDNSLKLSSDKGYLVIKVREVKIVKGVMACDVLPVAMFYYRTCCQS